MKKADLSALEKTLAHLPVDLKQHLANQLLGQINAQAHTLLETARSHHLCPHCGDGHVVKWGHSGGLQRYRCQSLTCHKTFNAVTGTSLARLHHRTKWFDYLRCMRDSLTLRVSAFRVGIDLKTAFRWRHRFLHASASSEHGIAHHRLVTLDNQRVIGKEYHIQNVNSYISRSKGWMARFHGVGTAYLPSYLAWRRLFERAQPSEEAWLRIAIGANQ